MKILQTSIGRLRLLGIAEGVSLLLLAFIAMPLKYMAGKPEAVKVIGWMHGLLFIAFMAAVLYVFYQRKWSFKKVLIAFIAALLPFGTFFFDARLKKEDQIV